MTIISCDTFLISFSCIKVSVSGLFKCLVTMKILFILLLAGYAVKCDDNKYYVVEMTDKDTKYEENRKTFKVYWNVPTMQCKSKRIPFEDLYQKYGILQNKNDRFRGEVISILYDPGLFPALLKNETSGRFKFRNGGVPQEGDMQRHLTLFRTVLEQSIPDKEFKGVGIIDFESWRPIFRQNFGVLVPYKDVSYELEKKLHWWWPKQWIQDQAKQRFEEAARSFMEYTLSIAKEMRPNAVWGYYGFPYCFNMANNNFKQSCAEKVSDENDRLRWLWSESSALFPSVYSSSELSAAQLEALITGRVEEAERVNRKATVLPYFWFRYRDDGYFSEGDLKTALSTLYKSNASGFIIWGSSNDVNTIAKCAKLQDYLEKTMGPAIAEYTKPRIKLRDKVSTAKPYHEKITIKPQNDKPQLDPEYHWIPPENYTRDIEHYVEEEIRKKPGYNRTHNDKVINETRLKEPNDSMLIDWLLNHLKDNNNINTNSTNFVSNGGKKVLAFDNITTASYETPNNDLETSETIKDSVIDEVNYNNNLDVRLNSTSVERKERSESLTTPNIIESFAVNTERGLEDKTTDIYESVVETKSTDIIESYLTTEGISIEDEFFNQNTFSEDNFKDPTSTDLTTEGNIDFKFNDVERSTETNDFVSVSEETEISRRVTAKVNINELNKAIASASTALDQVRSSSQVVSAHKPYICIIFYMYSVVKCLCAVFGNCS